MEENMKYTEQTIFKQEATSTRKEYGILNRSKRTVTTSIKSIKTTSTTTRTAAHDNLNQKIAGTLKERESDNDRDSDKDRDRKSEHSKVSVAAAASQIYRQGDQEPSQVQERFNCLCE